MSEVAIWILLAIAAGVAVAVTRINPTSWRPHHVRWVIIALVILGAAAVMEMSLAQSPLLGASGVTNGPASGS